MTTKNDANKKNHIGRLGYSVLAHVTKKNPLPQEQPPTQVNMSDMKGAEVVISAKPRKPIRIHSDRRTNTHLKKQEPILPKAEPMLKIFNSLESLSKCPSWQGENETSMEQITKSMAILQSAYNDADRAQRKARSLGEDFLDEQTRIQSQILKNKFSTQKQALENLLKAVPPANPYEQKIHNNIKRNLKILEDQIVVSTGFDDPKVNVALKTVKKEGGANPGYTITNTEHTRFTVKQGSTVGNTLSEVFSSMVLSGIVTASGEEKKSQVTIANAFLVVKAPDEKDLNLSVEERCKKSLFAASEWSSDKGSFEACQLFGLEKRKKGAGSRQSQDFEDLRKLNEACKLGLEKIIVPTALVADFDLHSENFMLKVNDSEVKVENQERVTELLKELKADMKKNDDISREDRVNRVIDKINRLKNLNANVYFHKIDHDSGFYRYADSKRKVDFLTHRTSPIHRQGLTFKTQPTLHITEITGGSKEGMDQLLLSKEGIDKLLHTDFNTELNIVIGAAAKFFEVVGEKSQKLSNGDTQQQRNAEFYLLNEFYHHIKEQRKPMPKQVTDKDINALRNELLVQLEAGTKLKVADLHTQVYKRLLEIGKNKELTVNERQLKTFLEGQDHIKPLMEQKKSILHAFSFIRR